MDQEPQQQQSSADVEKILSVFKSIQKSLRDRWFEHFKEYGFTAPQLALIFTLHRTPFATLQEVSDLMGLSKSTVSGIVERLVTNGTVIRETPKDNRRIVRLSLSEEFMKNYDLTTLKNRYIMDILDYATSEDLCDIINGLEKLDMVIKKATK